MLKDAAARGHKTIDGLGMLMHQAAPSFEAFFGVRPEGHAGACARHLEKVLVNSRRKPFVIGLTGSIGMGKSETARMFAAEGVPVYRRRRGGASALCQRGGAAVAPIEAAFPGTVRRTAPWTASALSKQVTGDPARTQETAKPWSSAGGGRKTQAFLEDADNRGADIVASGHPAAVRNPRRSRMDAVVVASAPIQVQRERVLARPGMTAEKFEALHGAPDDRR